MIVLKIIGCIILAIFAIIAAILSIKVCVHIEYSDESTNAFIKWLFLKIPIFPREKKEAAEKKVEPVPEQAEEPVDSEVASVTDNGDTAVETTEIQQDGAVTEDVPSEEAPAAAQQNNNLLKMLYESHGVDGLAELLRRVCSYTGKFVGDLSYSLIVDELLVDVRCTKKDAASTAIYYGEVCSLLFPLLSAFISKYKVRRYDINVYPDYLAKFSSVSFSTSFHLYPIKLCGVTVVFAVKMLINVLIRMLVKIFLHNKNKAAENSDKTVSEKNGNN